LEKVSANPGLHSANPELRSTNPESRSANLELFSPHPKKISACLKVGSSHLIF
jgi:hypothetical protein